MYRSALLGTPQWGQWLPLIIPLSSWITFLAPEPRSTGAASWPHRFNAAPGSVPELGGTRVMLSLPQSSTCSPSSCFVLFLSFFQNFPG